MVSTSRGPGAANRVFRGPGPAALAGAVGGRFGVLKTSNDGVPGGEGPKMTMSPGSVGLAPGEIVVRAAFQVRSIQKFFTHRPVSTFDRVPFQLTGELFLYGMALR